MMVDLEASDGLLKSGHFVHLLGYVSLAEQRKKSYELIKVLVHDHSTLLLTFFATFFLRIRFLFNVILIDTGAR